MKKISLAFAILVSGVSYSQNIGIGTTNAQELLTVNGTALIDASNINNGTYQTGSLLKFGTSGRAGIGSCKLPGKFFNGLDFYTNGIPFMRMDTTGNIGINSDPFTHFRLTVNGNTYAGGLGINTTTPDLSFYKLDVNASGRFRTDLFVNRDMWVDRNLDVDGTTNLFGNITAGGNMSVAGNILVDGSKGIIRSTNATQQVITYPSGSLSFTNAPAGYTSDVQFVIPNVFSSNPHISVAELTDMTGTFERWTMTIHSIDNTTRRFWVRFHNASSQTSTMTMTVHFIAVGPAL
jgi:hypothetical protein